MVPRAELEQALQHYQATVRRAHAEDDWTLFAQLFTEDAEYNEHAYGRFSGRAKIAEWAVRTMTTFPGSAMVDFPLAWSMLDTDRGWIVCEIRNLMRDPGDGSVHEASNLTVLHHAGGNLFAYEEDIYNPMRFLDMVAGWTRIAAEHGTLPEGARDWQARFAPSRG